MPIREKTSKVIEILHSVPDTATLTVSVVDGYDINAEVWYDEINNDVIIK